MRTTLYAAYHKPAPLIEGRFIKPMHVGRAGAETDLQGMIGDDGGTSISERNTTFCELTALYWAWKNDTDSAFIGLMHYRRVLDLSDRSPDTASVEVKPTRFEISTWVDEAEAALADHVDQFDLIIPRHHQMGRNVLSNYSKGHIVGDFELAREIIKSDHPGYLESFDFTASGSRVLLGNMFAMRRELLDEYCAWLFDILFKIEDRLGDRAGLSGYQTRYLGFLAERLFTVFVRHLRKTRPDIRIKEVSILNLSNATLVPAVTQDMRAAPDSVAIAFASDRTYLPHAAAMVRSVLDHVDPHRALDFVFLHSNINSEEMGMLADVVATHAGARLHPVNVSGAFDDSYRSSTRAPSNATYNRFLLFDVLEGFDRVIYLDADTIVLRDVSVLAYLNLGRNEIAGATDWIMTRTLTGPTKTIDPDTPDLGVHHRETLGLTDEQIGRYFNAGVLIFNFAAMDVQARRDQLMQEVRHGRYLFRDQDILNKVFKDSLLVLDPRWNVFNTGEKAYGRVPEDGRKAAMAAKNDPWIIHYADRAFKPWDAPDVKLAEHYWQALARTPFHDEVLSGKVSTRKPRRRHPIVEFGYKLSERFPILRGPMLRVYARILDIVRR